MTQNNDTFPTKAYELDKIKVTTFILRLNRHRPLPRAPKEEPWLLKRCGSTTNPRFNKQHSSVLPLYSPADTSILPLVDMSWLCTSSGVLQTFTGIYREILTFAEWFTALRFTATGASQEAKCIQILPMNQHNVRNEVVTIHRSQEVLKMLSLYT
jgi:hypothetical protein